MCVSPARLVGEYAHIAQRRFPDQPNQDAAALVAHAEQRQSQADTTKGETRKPNNSDRREVSLSP
jgi:hypothetical protein